MASGRLLLRATVGGLMLGHGLQKLRGNFGGPGLEGTEQMMGAIGMHPAKPQALAAALSETVGGGLTAVGLLSPLGPAMIIGTMAVAAQKVHRANGVWVTDGGFEYNLTLAAAAASLAASGTGPWALDPLLGKRREGVGWLLAAVGLAAAGAGAALAVAERSAPSGAEPVVTGTSGVTDAPKGDVPQVDPTTPTTAPPA